MTTMQEAIHVNEVTEKIAKNLTDEEANQKNIEIDSYLEDIESGLANESKVIHQIVFNSQKDIFQLWASKLKEKHYLGTYEKPINTICEYIFARVGKMQISTDKKENLHRNLRRSLDSEFKQTESSEGDKMSPKNTSEKNQNQQFLIHAFQIYIRELDETKDAAKIMLQHLQDPEISNDFANWVEWRDFAKFCSVLSQLHGEKSITEQMKDELNIRQSATKFQTAMAFLLLAKKSFRQMAYSFGVSPRQNQRIRTRQEDWPLKDLKKIIQKITGSYECPGCGLNLVTRRINEGVSRDKNTGGLEYDDKAWLKIRFGDKEYPIPDSIKKKFADPKSTIKNPIDIAYLIFAKKLKFKPQKNEKSK